MPSISTDALVKVVVVVCLALFFLATAFVRFSTKIVPENKRVVIMRFGKILGSQGPGIVTLIPIVDYAIWVDLQPTFHYKYGNLTTSDNQKISCAVTLEGKEQIIPSGPVASQIAIKQLGTNGGGFFNTNCAHPFENPTPLSNFLNMIAILFMTKFFKVLID